MKIFSAIIVGLLLLSGCGTDSSSSEDAPISVYTGSNAARMLEINGVTCIVLESGNTAAISCDWEGYHG